MALSDAQIEQRRNAGLAAARKLKAIDPLHYVKQGEKYGHLGGRPTWQQSVEKNRQLDKERGIASSADSKTLERKVTRTDKLTIELGFFD